MKRFLTKAALGAGLVAATLAASAPAEAQWRGGYHHYGHGDTTGAAILGGIVGLGVGAAIASSSRPRYYYDRGYYAPPPPPPVVYRERYYAPPPPPVVYRDPYYGGGYGGGYGYYGY